MLAHFVRRLELDFPSVQLWAAAPGIAGVFHDFGNPVEKGTLMADRKKGSNLFALVIGLALLLFGVAILVGHVDARVKDHKTLVDSGSALLFGGVLLYWRFTEAAEWGIGFETVTMVVGVVTALIAILALTAL